MPATPTLPYTDVLHHLSMTPSEAVEFSHHIHKVLFIRAPCAFKDLDFSDIIASHVTSIIGAPMLKDSVIERFRNGDPLVWQSIVEIIKIVVRRMPALKKALSEREEQAAMEGGPMEVGREADRVE